MNQAGAFSKTLEKMKVIGKEKPVIISFQSR